MFLKKDLSNFSAVFASLPLERGLFISFEGIEASGKSSQIERLKSFLTAQGFDVLSLREPGGSEFGEKLRATILGLKTKVDPLSEAFIFLASRAQLLQEKILPHLDGPKKAVILDRYIDSTLVYQGLSQGLGVEKLWSLHQFYPLSTLPHATFLLEIDVKTSMERQKSRGQEKDYFESRQLDFYQGLVDGYHQLALHYPGRIHRIDGSQQESHIQSNIQSILKNKRWA